MVKLGVRWPRMEYLTPFYGVIMIEAGDWDRFHPELVRVCSYWHRAKVAPAQNRKRSSINKERRPGRGADACVDR